MQKKKVNMIILVVSVLLTLIGLSYGYFFIKKNQDNNNVAGSKCFKLEFSNESEAINLTNMYPISVNITDTTNTIIFTFFFCIINLPYYNYYSHF